MPREVLMIKRNFDSLDTVEAVYFKLSTDLCQQLIIDSFELQNALDAIFCLWRMRFFALSSTNRQGKGLNAMNGLG